MIKFLSGIAILFLSFCLQFLLGYAGIHFNLILATLIAFAFIFEFAELLLFDLLAVFLVNWQPALSVPLIAFALIPLAAFAFRKFIRTELWIGILVAIFVGFLAFYLIAAPSFFFANIFQFVMDLVIGLIAGELVLFALN